jgi:hypothetical protein
MAIKKITMFDNLGNLPSFITLLEDLYKNMAILIGLIGLLIGAGLIKYSKRIVEYIWSKSTASINTTHRSPQKSASIRIIKLFGIIWSAVALLFIYFGIYGE